MRVLLGINQTCSRFLIITLWTGCHGGGCPVWCLWCSHGFIEQWPATAVRWNHNDLLQVWDFLIRKMVECSLWVRNELTHHVMEFRAGIMRDLREKAELLNGWSLQSSCPTSDCELWVVTETSGRDEEVRWGAVTPPQWRSQRIDLGIWAPHVSGL